MTMDSRYRYACCGAWNTDPHLGMNRCPAKPPQNFEDQPIDEKPMAQPRDPQILDMVAETLKELTASVKTVLDIQSQFGKDLDSRIADIEARLEGIDLALDEKEDVPQ